jgi:hypothetical protein
LRGLKEGGSGNLQTDRRRTCQHGGAASLKSREQRAIPKGKPTTTLVLIIYVEERWHPLIRVSAR